MIESWEKIGVIGVDAGMCWIGDPCYILHPDKTPEDIGKDWFGFCDKMAEGCGRHQCLDQRQFKYDGGHDGLGVCVRTGHGDGVEVEARIEGKIIKEIRIKFAD